MNENIINIKTITQPDVPNKNGIVYSKEAKIKAIERFQEKIDSGRAYLTDGSIYIYGRNNAEYPYTSEFQMVRFEQVIGKIHNVSLDSIDVEPFEYSNHPLVIKDFLERGYLPGMRYIGELTKNSETGIIEVNDINIISFDMLDVNYTPEKMEEK